MPYEPTKECPLCGEMIHADAIKCRYCGSCLDTDSVGRALHSSWTRTHEGRKIGGVCAGLAKEFGISVTLLRLAFVIGFFFGGWAIVIYLGLWFLMPLEEDRLARHAGGHSDRIDRSPT